MKQAFITNSGPNNLRDFLKGRMDKAADVSIAVAFITEKGLSEILPRLSKSARDGRVRVLTGLYQSVTEPAALRTLCRLQLQTAERLEVRLSTETGFHRKLYLVRGKRQTSLVVGSSNLTGEGLLSSGELNLALSMANGSLNSREALRVFDMDWVHRSVPATPERIKRYEAYRQKQTAVKGMTAEEMKNILGKQAKHVKAAAGSPSVARVWRDRISGFAEKATVRVISENTDWDKKGYGWYSVNGPSKYTLGDALFLFDLANKRFEYVRVRDITQTPTMTPDGKHFVAYKTVHGFSRRLTDTFWKRVKAIGLTKKQTGQRALVGAGQAEQLKALARASKRKAH